MQPLADACNNNPAVFTDFLLSPCASEEGDATVPQLSQSHVGTLLINMALSCDVHSAAEVIYTQWPRFEAVGEEFLQHPNTKYVRAWPWLKGR